MKLKHCFQRFAAALACLMLCMLCVPQAALAAGEGYIQLTDDQLKQLCTITLNYKVNGKADDAMEGVKFQVFKVADMTRDVQFTLAEQFTGYQNLDPNQLRASLGVDTWPKAAEALYQYCASNSLTPDAEMTVDASGNARAAGLPVGLYLVAGEATHTGTDDSADETYYRPAPFLVALPLWSREGGTGHWVFNVEDVAAKPVEVLTGRRVLKRWTNGGTPVPVDVQLYRDGEAYGEAVTLNSENNWRHDFGDLEQGHVWTLQEVTVLENYTVNINQEGITFVVTNRYQGGGGGEGGEDPGPSPRPSPRPNPDEEIEEPEVPLVDMPNVEIDDPEIPLSPFDPEPEEEIPEEEIPLADLPQTGLLWWPVPVLAAGGVLFFLLGLSRNRRREY